MSGEKSSVAATTAASSPAAPAAAKHRVDPLAIIVRFQSLIGLVLVAIGGVIFSPRRHGEILFLNPDNIANIVRAVSETGIIAIGMTFVIITAGIDLSVGAVLGLSAVVTAAMMISGGFGLIATILAVLVMGTVFGIVQGTISTRFRLEPFIVTLAGLQAARGLALVVSGNQYINISYGDGPGLAPPVFAVLGERLFDNTVPVATIVFIIFAAIATLVLNTTRFGRYVYAVGGNERAARISGVPVSMVKISVYAITGFASALAGIVHAGQFNFGSANDGMGYELTAIAAVVIGGTSLFGGAGSMVGTVAGTIMLGALANILQLNNITPAMQLLATAAIIVLAAVLQSLVRRREGLGR
ncbi:ABC transporter permease [Mesorhizobium sp. VK22B]|uniref:ABC transporter permease n=1 Tax=Mesorhizobium captivum TaxID=3072319 RepID=A0ABU4YZ98_9HYPH|nr:MULTISPECIES: ABC transporter permease [unclassified Mesorhizobium]MDX8492280.1 ABC transporter permease [Mesorhizobium sp. VK22B]MDX8506254.1 ABC transporter permease [Mesorhizobium sp. VK22E]